MFEWYDLKTQPRSSGVLKFSFYSLSQAILDPKILNQKHILKKGLEDVADIGLPKPEMTNIGQGNQRLCFDGLSFYGPFYGMTHLLYIFSQYIRKQFQEMHDMINDRVLTELYLARIQVYK